MAAASLAAAARPARAASAREASPWRHSKASTFGAAGKAYSIVSRLRSSVGTPAWLAASRSKGSRSSRAPSLVIIKGASRWKRASTSGGATGCAGCVGCCEGGGGGGARGATRPNMGCCEGLPNMGSAGMRSARNVSKSVPTISAASSGFCRPHRAPSASERCLSLSVSAVQSRSAPPSAPPMRSQASRQSVRRPQRAGSEALGLRGGRGWYRDEPAEAKLSEESVRDDPAPTEAPVMDDASS